jgi:hypothetical protein
MNQVRAITPNKKAPDLLILEIFFHKPPPYLCKLLKILCNFYVNYLIFPRYKYTTNYIGCSVPANTCHANKLFATRL